MTRRVSIDEMIALLDRWATSRELGVERMRDELKRPEKDWKHDADQAAVLRAAERLLARIAHPRVRDRIRAILKEADAVERKAREGAAARRCGHVEFRDGAETQEATTARGNAE